MQADFKRHYFAEEEKKRKLIFTSNLEFILRHNELYKRGLQNFTVGLNHFADLTNQEYREFYTGLKTNGNEPLGKSPQIQYASNKSNLPDTVDWTTKGVVTPIKQQSQCYSCWAFSAVASIESQHAIKTGNLVSLSEQNLVDCSITNKGCDGGTMDDAFEYVIQNKGIDTEAAYPYRAVDGKCNFKNNSIGATIVSYTKVQKGSELALKSAVADIGPVSVGIDASKLSFQFYQYGVYDEPDCSEQLNHGVTVVGYGTLNGVAHWKVKNSWGTSWGDRGYIKMSRNKRNQCGIANLASYPVV